MTLDLFLNVQFQNRKPIADRKWIGSLNVEQVVVQVEAIRQAVRRINAHNQCLVAKLSKSDARCGREAGLPHAALARKHQNPHAHIIAGISVLTFQRARLYARSLPFERKPFFVK